MKEACPEEMTIEEREYLLANSYSEDDDPLNPKRYAVRRRDGRLEWYRTLLTVRHPDGSIEVHGHPFEPGYPKVPTKVLRRMRDAGCITASEYKQMVRK